MALWLDTIVQDVRDAVRSVRRNAGVAAVAVISLGLAIGANAAIFSVVHAVLLRALPYRDASQLVVLWTTNNLNNTREQYTSMPTLRDWRERSHSFTEMAAAREGDGSLVAPPSADVEWSSYAWITGNFFPLLGRAPILGRAITEDDVASHNGVAVISDRLWLRRFNRSAQALGARLTLAGIDLTIVGIMPDDFRLPRKETDLWLPGSLRPGWDRTHEDRGTRFGAVFARLADGVTPAQASTEMQAIAAQLAREYPAVQRDLGVNLVPLQMQINGRSVPFMLTMLLGAVGIVLLIACANVANLLLARGVTRGREMAVRVALGASRGRLARQLLTEHTLLACLAGGLGLLLAAWSLRVLVARAPSQIARLDEVQIDLPVLAFTLIVSLACGLLFGLVPIVHLSRGDQGSMRLRDRTASGTRSVRVARRAFVVCQFALAIVLLTGAGLLIRSLLAVHAVDSGFSDRRVLTAHLRFDTTLPRDRRARLFPEAMSRIAALPGVRAMGAISTMFWGGESNNFGLRAVRGQPVEPRERWTPLTWATVSGDYFQALGVPLIRGRLFTDRDRVDAPLVAIINETLARRYWPDADPIGQQVKGFDPRGQHDDWLTVVGVVQDVHSNGLERAPIAQIFQPQMQSLDETENLVVAADAGVTIEALQRAVRELDRTAVLSDPSTLAQTLATQTAARRFQTLLLTVFAGLALLLAGAGLFAMMHYAVAQRTQEIGIRMALGAQRAQVLRMVFREGLSIAGVGMAVGVAGALAVMQTITSLLFGVSPQDPATFVAVSLVLTGMAVAGCYMPARRATRVDPMIALRPE
jgi:predicted permease